MANEEWGTCDKVMYFAVVCYLTYTIVTVELALREIPVPNVELASMDFTVLNITKTRLSAKWDLSIMILCDRPRSYICHQGDFKASLHYKNVTLATSSLQKYYNLQYYHPQFLDVELEKDIGGLVGQEIMEDIREKKEVNFGLRFFMSDCRHRTTGMMSYECSEAVLRFEPGSEMKATVFGNHPSCINF